MGRDHSRQLSQCAAARHVGRSREHPADAAGFNVKLKNGQDINALVAEILNTKSFDVGCWGLIFEEAPEIGIGQSLLSTSPGQRMNTSTLDAQIKIVREAKTDAERKATIEKIQDDLEGRRAVAGLRGHPEIIAWQKKVHGLSDGGHRRVLRQGLGRLTDQRS